MVSTSDKRKVGKAWKSVVTMEREGTVAFCAGGKVRVVGRYISA